MNQEVDVGAVLKGQRIFLFRLECSLSCFPKTASARRSAWGAKGGGRGEVKIDSLVRVRKSRFADTARRWGGYPEGGVVFLRLSSDQWTHGARCLMVVKWWPS